MPLERSRLPKVDHLRLTIETALKEAKRLSEEPATAEFPIEAVTRARFLADDLSKCHQHARRLYDITPTEAEIDAAELEENSKISQGGSADTQPYPVCECGHRYDHHTDPGDPRKIGCHRCECKEYVPIEQDGAEKMERLAGFLEGRGVH